MLFLIDSNIAITSDPMSHELEAGAESAMQFMRLTATHHHDVRTHPACLMDFARIKDPAKRQARLVVFERYTKLASPPVISQAQKDELGVPVAGTNDDVDQLLLAAVVGNAAEYLVTEDDGMHRRARRLGVEDRVLRLSDAILMLRALHADLPDPPPSVRAVKTHELSIDDAIFDGLKDDYGRETFVGWFERCARTQRDALVVDGDDDDHAAIVILKPEPTGEHGLAGPQLKVCTFKVADAYNGQKYGELLLKAIFERAHREQHVGLFVTVLEKQTALIALLQDFGFRAVPGVLTDVGELVYEKPLMPVAADAPDSMSALDFHVRYGPPVLRVLDQTCHAIPIEPRWHRILFPDAEREPAEEDALFAATEGLATQPFGNALRKAYLCNARSRLLQPGDPLLFYRSKDEKAVFVVGVVEATLRSHDPLAIAAAVGRRTVYSLPEIEGLTRKGEVLVIMFRQARILREEPISLTELIAGGVLASHPQAVSKTRPEGTSWLAQRLDE
ncbi:GNAT family N-acetyltransferase [Nocardioides alkalitolerans]|uniref:GNAT family N-acetyltransferase n=1 Tax=Nocardioides alkalitolerans TaxID=281714 RepID=UPI00048E18C3|nr:GNAT family N-acetyltransferase [Nocardioides alkalitolerans]